MNLNKTLKKNSNLEQLYNEINSWKPVVLEKSDEKTWGSRVNSAGEAMISHAKTNNYPESLAHELLHFKLQRDGYRRIYGAISYNKNLELASKLVAALDNELQHHRMYQDFLKMGFQKEKFYFDGDSKTSSYLDDILKTKPNTIESLLLDYFTAIAPGGHLSNKQIIDYKKRFRDKLGASDKFDQIDDLLESWLKSTNYDAENMIRVIFLLIEKPTKTWISYTIDGSGFPDSGYFIDEQFTPDENGT